MVVKSLGVKSGNVWWSHISWVGVYWWAPYSNRNEYCRHIHSGYISSILKMSNDYSEWCFFSLFSFKGLLKLWPLELTWEGLVKPYVWDQISIQLLLWYANSAEGIDQWKICFDIDLLISLFECGVCVYSYICKIHSFQFHSSRATQVKHKTKFSSTVVYKWSVRKLTQRVRC